MRLDKYILSTFNLRSRTYAENLILTGSVLVNGVAVLKPSFDITNEEVSLIDDGYASQGAYKLEEAFETFHLEVSGKLCADIGCSNGGFTDCLLRHGADRVIAVDVAECALSEALLDSGRVTFVKANARELPVDFPSIQFVCSDVSFISLGLVLPQIHRILQKGGEAVVLVKPQFELDRSALTKSGIVTSGKLREHALNKIVSCALSLGFEIAGKVQAPIRYQNKNIEYLLYLKKPL